METYEYSVCEDCFFTIAHGVNDNSTDEQDQHLEERMKAELAERKGRFSCGVQPTEEDPEGRGYEEFSHHDCELCNSGLAGSRYGVTLVITP